MEQDKAPILSSPRGRDRGFHEEAAGLDIRRGEHHRDNALALSDAQAEDGVVNEEDSETPKRASHGAEHVSSRPPSESRPIQRLVSDTVGRENTWGNKAQELDDQAIELLKEADRHENTAKSVASEQKAPISLKLLKQAYAYSRVASLDLASKMHAALPRENDSTPQRNFPYEGSDWILNPPNEEDSDECSDGSESDEMQSDD
ncbi:uncharacterized protein BDZ99DRAFT_568808 [Mytilinidion resinicola]|uniref:Uncharacterized protein n=1 Tax=Mytilinidion resinicola TaxID=574789 RepID=A0A6A6YTF6_9PEZI|nr:uncharacterized protein BDZ99DRAFT_568808 [Mytilinidion resinicola]KAF2812051.1 hypothetical protein BDZ99DRAFT_568808 [Mytilinidion resinicola]